MASLRGKRRKKDIRFLENDDDLEKEMRVLGKKKRISVFRKIKIGVFLNYKN